MKPILPLLFFLTFSMSSLAQQCTVNGIFIDAILVDPNSGTNNFDSDSNGTAQANDEFVQICNSNATSTTLTGFTLADDDGISHDLSAVTIPAGMCVVVITNYTPATVPANFVDLNVANWLNNGGDVITLSDGTNNCTITYSSTPAAGEWAEQDGCLTVANANGVGGSVDCSLTPASIGATSLPVELTYFTAELMDNETVALNWATASEEDNSHFEVQHSLNGQDWTTLGEVPGFGNSETLRTYSFDHATPAPGSNLYRLKQIDFGGTFAYSDIVNAELGSALRIIASNPSTIELFSPEDGILFYELYSTNGQLIRQERRSIDQGNISIEIPEGLSKGLYLIRFRVGEETLIYKHIN